MSKLLAETLIELVNRVNEVEAHLRVEKVKCEAAEIQLKKSLEDLEKRRQEIERLYFEGKSREGRVIDLAEQLRKGEDQVSSRDRDIELLQDAAKYVREQTDLANKFIRHKRLGAQFLKYKKIYTRPFHK